MKILYVITRAERGGAQVHLRDLLANLPKEHEAVVAAGEDGFLFDECRRLGVPVRHVPSLVRPMHPLKDCRALVALVSLIRRQKPDLVHAHTSKAGLLARLAARITATPVVFTAHAWSFANGLPAFQRWVAIPLERLAAAVGGRIITVSDANREKAQRQSIARGENLTRIWNGIPDTGVSANPGTRDCTTIITVARFAPQKDHILLLQALSHVDGNWRLIFVGDGPTRRQVESTAAELGLSSRIEFLGDRSDIPQLLSQVDVFVLPSKSEGLPLVILEAMRAGLPVIATNVGGVAEAVADGITGFLTGVNDEVQLRNRIQQLIASPELMRKMGRAGRRQYEQDFQIEIMVRKTVAVYEEVAYGVDGRRKVAFAT
jgi:glycosyltransferase involved in cell wall biosynthesis